MKEMTRTEFLNKYGDINVVFTDYYKYTFNYKFDFGDGSYLTVSVGGDPDEIYRESVVAGEECSVSSLYPYKGYLVKDNETTEGFYDY